MILTDVDSKSLGIGILWNPHFGRKKTLWHFIISRNKELMTDNDHHRRHHHDSLMWTQVPFDFHHGFVYSFVTSSLFVPFEILRNEFERENVNRKK